MELKHVTGNTYYLEGRQLMPVYLLDESTCILFDPGRKNERAGIEAVLQQHGLHPAGVMITHMHYDHHENSAYFKNQYGSQVAMARQDAELCRDRVALRNHLYTFSPGLLQSEERLRDVICPVDRPIWPEETRVYFAGAHFGILHTPGHSPAHLCITTPDDVCFVGDVLMLGEDLATVKVPFVFDLAEDIKSKKKLAQTAHTSYLFSHQGELRGSLNDLTEQNLRVIDDVLALFLRHVPEPRSLCEIYAAVNQDLGLAEGHPLRAFYLERYLRPYLDYLMDTGALIPAPGGGAPTLAPASYKA